LSAIRALLQKLTSVKSRTAVKPGNSANEGAGVASGRRAAVTDALNRAVEIFAAHKEKTFDEVMANGIRPLADAVGLDRVVFYALVDRDGAKQFGQIYRWDKSKGGLMFLDEELRVLPDIPVIEKWISITSRGGRVKLRQSDYSEDEAAFLRAYGITSILMVPVFTRGEFWGVISYQNHNDDRYFDEDCADLLHTAAYVFSNAVTRVGMERSAEEAVGALKRREKMASALNRAAVKFLSRSAESFETAMTAGVKEIADVFDLDRFSLLRNFIEPDGSYRVKQIYRWDRKSGGTTMPRKELSSFSPDRYLPAWWKVFARGGIINSPVRLLPEAPVLRSFDLVSICVTPVFIDNGFWGIAFFEDLHDERFFEEDSVEMMRSAAFLCANTIIRADMEREIDDINEFNRAVLDASPIGFTIFDENARVIGCNDVTLKALKTTRRYFLEHFYEFSSEYQEGGIKSANKAAELAKRAINGERVVLEWTHRTATGEYIPFEITVARAMNKGRYMVLGYQYDLRNIKKMSENLREQDEQLKIRLKQQELISELSRGFISSGNSETLVREAIAKLGRFHDVSLVFVFALDYQREDTRLAYHWCADGVEPRNAIANLYGHLIRLFPVVLPDGTAIPIVTCDDTAAAAGAVFQALHAVDIMAVIGAPLYVEGRLWGVMCVEQSLTPRAWTENEKEFVATTASTIAGIIMRDIYTVKLKDALHKATEASKAKSEFLSNMSHEMRTPLNAITGMTVIGRNAQDIEHKDYALDKIEGASTHLLGVINDILDMSKIEANMLELSPVEFDFEKMLQKVVAVINFRVEEKQQKLVVRIDREIPHMIIADDQRLAQVVTNLLSNAVKFTPEQGAITLNARFIREENGLCVIQVSVKDSGIGISEEQQTRLFSSFQQAESSTTRKYGGTGLGLAISKSIVEMMGGSIWVRSEPGKGAVFTFEIRAKRGSEEGHKHLLDVNLNDVRIMAVDDDPDFLNHFLEITQRFGVLCDTAISGEKALQLIDQKGSYHIYFIDWKMPGMDGIQLARAVKARDPDDSVVIIISAAEWTTVADEMKEAGVQKFLSKPLFPSSIMDVINECLGLDQRQAEKVPAADIENIFAGRRILLAEDVEINREIVQTLLEPTGLEIDCAENGAEAVRMFAEAPDRYDMIFMDVQMPEIDGNDATRRIRALDIPAAKSVPIVAMTANVFREDIEECLAAGMNSHIGKPLDFEEVLDRLHTFLDANKALGSG